MSTGSIAYRVLKKESPDTIPKVVAILKKHPYYNTTDAPPAERWKPKLDALANEDERDEYLFMLAARWPDDARDDHDHYPPGKDYDKYHYINQPFVPPGEPNWVKTVAPADINIFRGYDKFLDQFADGSTNRERAIGLCWVLHLIGDAHQPLHTASLFTRNFQREGDDDTGKLVGDRGGTRFYVRGKPGGSAVHLHKIWDGLVASEDDYKGNHDEVSAILKDPEHAKDKFTTDLTRTGFDDWIDESFSLAKSKAYFFNGKLLKGSPTKGGADALPDGYTKAVEPVAKRRAVLAGYRIAYVLKKVLDE